MGAILDQGWKLNSPITIPKTWRVLKRLVINMKGVPNNRLNMMFGKAGNKLLFMFTFFAVLRESQNM